MHPGRSGHDQLQFSEAVEQRSRHRSPFKDEAYDIERRQPLSHCVFVCQVVAEYSNVGSIANLGPVGEIRHHTSAPTIELTWALILTSVHHFSSGAASVRAGGWQHNIGDDLPRKTLAILCLGRVGTGVAKVGLAFGMDVIVWSQNLTSDVAMSTGVRLVSKEALSHTADVISIHMVLSSGTIGLIGAKEFALMKPSARLIDTSRDPLVIEAALLHALANNRIAGDANAILTRA